MKLVGIILLISINAFAQESKPVWSTHVDPNIQWMSLSPEGTLIIANKDTVIIQHNELIRDSAFTKIDTVEATILSGIDQNTGALKWNFKARARVDGVDQFGNLPYVQLRNVPLTIMDPRDGRLIIDGVSEQIAVTYGCGILKESGHLWIDAAINGARGLSLFDPSTGKKLWTRYDYFSMPDRTDITVAQGYVNLGSKGGKRQSLLCPPITLDKDYMVLATGDKVYYNNVYKVFIQSGEVAWKTDAFDPTKSPVKLEPDTTFFRLIPGRNRFFYAGPKWITACSYDDGKVTWTSPVKINSKIGEIIYDEKGLILCSITADVDSPTMNGRFLLVDENIGAALWQYPLNINGGMSKYQKTSKGLAVVMENPQFALAPEVEGSYLNFIDITKGTYQFEDPIRLPGRIRNLQTVPKGVYYSTDRTSNIVDLNGKPLLDIPRGLLQTEDSMKTWFYHDHNLYEIDKTNATKRQINKEKINFQGTDSPAHIERRKDGVLLYSAQNIVFIDFTGATRYLLHYKLIVNWFDKNELESFDFKKTPETKGTVLTNSESAFVVFTKTPGKNTVSIIDKDTGKELSHIDRPNGDMPTYSIDSHNGVLFFLSKTDNSIAAYRIR